MDEKYELTKLQEAELKAMVGNREAVIQVVSALRRYREEVKNLLADRYRDGECDATALHTFQCRVGEIEELYWEGFRARLKR